jgi:hypothetical protein
MTKSANNKMDRRRCPAAPALPAPPAHSAPSLSAISAAAAEAGDRHLMLVHECGKKSALLYCAIKFEPPIGWEEALWKKWQPVLARS